MYNFLHGRFEADSKLLLHINYNYYNYNNIYQLLNNLITIIIIIIYIYILTLESKDI